MLLRDVLPPIALSEFVKCYRLVHMTFDKKAQIGYKPYTPRPENCLVFYPRDREQVAFTDSSKIVNNLSVVLCGQPLTTTNRYVGHDFLALQIHFQPGALYRLTGVPLIELTNVYMTADNVFTKDIHFVNEQLYHATSYAAMIEILNQFVVSLTRNIKKDSHLLDKAANLMLNQQGNLSLDWIRNESCLSIKQFERKFKERTGVNPKVFNRLIRFDKAYRTKNAKPHLDWLSVAIECDYYDYQHLVRDYKDFTGFSPNAFLALDGQAPERALGVVEEFYKVGLK
jgi:AraC-like DNA-binding protein